MHSGDAMSASQCASISVSPARTIACLGRAKYNREPHLQECRGPSYTLVVFTCHVRPLGRAHELRVDDILGRGGVQRRLRVQEDLLIQVRRAIPHRTLLAGALHLLRDVLSSPDPAGNLRRISPYITVVDSNTSNHSADVGKEQHKMSTCCT